MMATAKQIAARAKFAAMARSGAFKRKPGASTKKPARKANPVPPKRGDSDEYFIEVEGGGWLVDYKTHSRPINWQYSRAFSGAQSFNVAQAARVKSVCDEYGLNCAVMPVTENPAKRKGVTRPSQATGKAPTKRLVQRRKKTAKAPPGYFANPKKPGTVRSVARTAERYMGPGEFEVYTAKGYRDAANPKLGTLLARFPSKSAAQEYARAYADAKGVAVFVVGQ